jgi:transcriptional regulator with GAF, ATPase, and Fis domain
VFPVDVPPLRERDEDIVQLAQHFLEHTCKEFGRDTLPLTRAHAATLRAYNWPGNVRELKNVIERAVILSPGKILRLDLSMPGMKSDGQLQAPAAHDDSEVLTEKELRALQKTNIEKALKRTGWKVSGKGGAAELLGVRPTTLADRIRTFRIRKPARGAAGGR